MEFEKKIELICDLLELEPQDFTPETKLDDLEEWDSLAAISYIVMMDEEFNVVAKPDDIKKFETIQDILDTMK